MHKKYCFDHFDVCRSTSNAQQNSKTDNLNIEVRGLVRDAHTKEPLNAVQINVVNKNLQRFPMKMEISVFM